MSAPVVHFAHHFKRTNKGGHRKLGSKRSSRSITRYAQEVNALAEGNVVHPISIYWTEGGNHVEVAGSFTQWQPFPLRKEESGVWSAVVNLPAGIYPYKFIIDGEWKYAKDQQIVTDEAGHVNNVLSVTRTAHHDENKPRENVKSFKKTESTDGFEVGSLQRSRSHLLIPGVHGFSTKNKKMIERTEGEPIQDTTSCLSEKLLVVMVGLPARGKSFVSRKLSRYLHWLGFTPKVFNLGNYRREIAGPCCNHDYFRADNPDGASQREYFAKLALTDAFEWLQNKGNIAIYDGTNSTVERRQMIIEEVTKIRDTIQISVMFVEIICGDTKVIERNILSMKTSSPDYVGVDKQQIINDFKERIRHYEDAYVTVQDDRPYVKIIDVGKKIVVNRIYGYLPTKIVFYLGNLHIMPRTIFLCRHGENVFNVQGLCGGDSNLTDKGRKFAKKLDNWMRENPDKLGSYSQQFTIKDVNVWSSTAIASVATSAPLSHTVQQYVRWKALDEMDFGLCDAMTPEEIQERFPEDVKGLEADKLRYRYPRGESLLDVIRRLEPVIMELERQRKPVIVIAHLSILRCLLAFLTDVPLEKVADIDIPLHTLIRVEPLAYGVPEQRFQLMDNGGTSG